MSHLGERITEYVFEELAASEMSEARAHVAQCGECKMAVEHFQRTRSLLQAVPDLDPPRSAVLTFDKPKPVRRWAWRWLTPMATAAVLVLAFALAAPIHVQWQRSQLTIALGAPVAQPSEAEQQTVTAIQELQSQMSYLKSLNEKQQREIYETAAQLSAQRSSTVGD